MSLTTSPFPPIADYAFLSNCTPGAGCRTALVDWLCVPAFDSPSAFGNLDRGAGSFRFGPTASTPTSGPTCPAPTLTTTWHTPGGWIRRPRRLDHGPRRGPDTVTPHTRPPADNG